MARSVAIKAPKHLKRSTRRWFESVAAEYDLEQHHLKLLLLASEAWDRTTDAREALAKHGIVYVDRFSVPRARPEVAIERDSRLAFVRTLRELGLDVNSPAEPYSRSPVIAGNANRRLG